MIERTEDEILRFQVEAVFKAKYPTVYQEMKDNIDKMTVGMDELQKEQLLYEIKTKGL